MGKEPYLTAKQAAGKLGVSISAVHQLCKRRDSEGREILKNQLLGRDRYFKQSWLDEYLADENAQKRRRASWRRDPEKHANPGADAKSAEHHGQVAGHNLPAVGTKGVLSYVDASGKLQSMEVAEKHIIMSPGASQDLIPGLSTEQSTYIEHDGLLVDPATGHGTEYVPVPNGVEAEPKEHDGARLQIVRSARPVDDRGPSIRDIALMRLGKWQGDREPAAMAAPAVVTPEDVLAHDDLEIGMR